MPESFVKGCVNVQAYLLAYTKLYKRSSIWPVYVSLCFCVRLSLSHDGALTRISAQSSAAVIQIEEDITKQMNCLPLRIQKKWKHKTAPPTLQEIWFTDIRYTFEGLYPWIQPAAVSLSQDKRNRFLLYKRRRRRSKKNHTHTHTHRKEREKNSTNWSDLGNCVPSTYFTYSSSRHQMWKQKTSTANAERILSHRHTFEGWNPWRQSAAVSRSQVKRNKLWL
jgi:hypothetical protein